MLLANGSEAVIIMICCWLLVIGVDRKPYDRRCSDTYTHISTLAIWVGGLCRTVLYHPLPDSAPLAYGDSPAFERILV